MSDRRVSWKSESFTSMYVGSLTYAGAKGDKKGKNGTKAVKAKGGVKKTSSKPKAKQAAAPEPAGEPAAVVPAAAEAPTLEPKPEPVQA